MINKCSRILTVSYFSYSFSHAGGLDTAYSETDGDATIPGSQLIALAKECWSVDRYIATCPFRSERAISLALSEFGPLFCAVV